MAPRIHRILETNPFLSHARDGWPDGDSAADPGAADSVQPRFPACFSVSQEGRNRCLYLTPTGFPSLHAALALPDTDLAVMLEGALDARPPQALPWDALRALGCEGEIVHLPAALFAADRAAAAPLPPGWEDLAQALPVPLLSNLADAVPAHAGSQVAISVQDSCHGVIVSPDVALLARCLRGYLEEYQLAVLGRDASLPAVDEQALAALLEPDPPGGWRALSLEPGRRFWTLQIRAHGDAGGAERCWVSEGEGGRWRSGWAW